MCLDERYTESRGRPPAPILMARRTRAWRRSVAFLNLAMSAPLLLLAFLAEDVFASILHALALVGLRRTERADFGGNLADLLLVDARDHDLGRLRRRDRDAFRNRIEHLMTVTERDLQVLALQRRAIADAGDL